VTFGQKGGDGTKEIHTLFGYRLYLQNKSRSFCNFLVFYQRWPQISYQAIEKNKITINVEVIYRRKIFIVLSFEISIIFEAFFP
jgi:hypothetical protein